MNSVTFTTIGNVKTVVKAQNNLHGVEKEIFAMMDDRGGHHLVEVEVIHRWLDHADIKEKEACHICNLLRAGYVLEIEDEMIVLKTQFSMKRPFKEIIC